MLRFIMETVLVKLKGEFNNIITVRNSVKSVFDILQVRIDKLRQIYSEFIKSNKNEMFLFGLDSFHFQSKLIDIEYDDMKRLFLAINNRMYCEYFKLHKIIVDYISNNLNDKKNIDLVKINNYPIYKDLEPFKEYKFELILEIHESILNMLNIAISILNNKENELSIHKTKQNIGLNIDNFITTFNFNISVMREKIMMFINYIEFFHKMHSKYLKRFSNKIQLMYTHINNDIKFDDSIEISKNKKKELIDDFASNDIDKELLKDLKTSIGSETNSEDSSSSSDSKLKFKNNHSINFPSPANSLSSSVSFNNENNSPLNLKRKGFKKIFQNNFHKVSTMFDMFNSKNQTTSEDKLSNNELDKMFADINQSCDLIIDDNNIGVTVDYYEQKDSDSETLLYQDFNNEDNIPYYDNDYRENIKTNSLDNKDCELIKEECKDEECKDEECKDEGANVTELNDEINSLKNEDVNTDHLNSICESQPEIVHTIEEPLTSAKSDKKKKRSNKKKK
jgi:hypothetical protein